MKNLVISEVEKFIPHLNDILEKLGKERKYFSSPKILTPEKVLKDQLFFIGVANINNQVENIYADDSKKDVFNLLTNKTPEEELNPVLFTTNSNNENK